MSSPRLEIDLYKIEHNARVLVEKLAVYGISVTGVTKSMLGSTEIANALLRAGVCDLGDSRIENIEAMRHRGVLAQVTLIRSPMLDQTERTVLHASASCNSEIEVVRKLSMEARKHNRSHGVLLMVELGDLCEGIMPDDIIEVVGEILKLPNIDLRGIATNLACRNGVSPDSGNMLALSEIADAIEATYNINLEVVSGGNSANIQWALTGAREGRINNLRLGESVLLGRETLQSEPIDGLYTDAFELVAEVIESKIKPSLPRGKIGQPAFGSASVATDRGDVRQIIVAMGEQDVDPDGLLAPDGIVILGASNDHMILECTNDILSVGEEVTFQVNYSALVRAMTSPFVKKIYSSRTRCVS